MHSLCAVHVLHAPLSIGDNPAGARLRRKLCSVPSTSGLCKGRVLPCFFLSLVLRKLVDLRPPQATGIQQIIEITYLCS